jgi:hypothetical protein
MTSRYLLAKYVSNLERNEPRNIGIILWTPECVEARFAAERDNSTDIDGRSIPNFVTSANAYRQWVKFWRALLQKARIPPMSGGAEIARFQPEFLDTLATYSKGNFLLATGGMLLDPIDADQVQAVAASLFGYLVDTGSSEESRDPTLDDVCDQLIAQTPLSGDPNFLRAFPVRCRISESTGEEEEFEFSYAYRNGCLSRLYQRVPLPRQRRVSRRNVDAAAWMFENVVREGFIRKEEGAALILLPEDGRQDDVETERLLTVLGSVTRVLNVAQSDEAINEFRAVAALPIP